MKLFITALTGIMLATSAFAGGLSPSGGKYSVKRGAAIQPQGSCSGAVLIGGCGYCIGGKYYSL